ncbi:uncharacterized protein [Leptinotarsa decemlineata]|uniref:uncharacterized protein n=1 Tax=Leptinotarsa decemlineata TaxID=7539 RepID=UPI003D3068A8
MESQLMKYYKEKSRVEKLSIHHLVNTLPNKPANAIEFINYCRSMMDTSSCNEANLATIDQNDCLLWRELRNARITASKMHEEAHCKVFEGTLCESIMGAIKLKDTEAMKRGRLLEKKVLKEVEKKMKLKINGCGLILNPNYLVFGASPDDESIDNSIEIKCPSSEKAMSSNFKSIYIILDNGSPN